MFNYDEAAKFWAEKMPHEGDMPTAELAVKIITFAKTHNTLALATCKGDLPHITPLEYFFYKGSYYIFTEGGAKFKYLKDNKSIAFTIYDSYKGNKVKSIQAYGFAEVVDEESDLYKEVFKQKGLNLNKLKEQGVSLHLLKLSPTMYTYLDSSLKEEGYNTMQRSLMCVAFLDDE